MLFSTALCDPSPGNTAICSSARHYGAVCPSHAQHGHMPLCRDTERGVPLCRAIQAICPFACNSAVYPSFMRGCAVMDCPAEEHTALMCPEERYSRSAQPRGITLPRTEAYTQCDCQGHRGFGARPAEWAYLGTVHGNP